jgi:hypothetical protein
MSRWRYWMHGLGGDDQAATARKMKEAGFDVVVASSSEAVAIAAEAGLEPWQCGGAFGLGGFSESDEHRACNVLGRRRVWFGSGCPNHPDLRDQNLKSYEGLAATDGIAGILVDGCRFASPASGLDAFATCFCDICREKATRLGFQFDRMLRDVRAFAGALKSDRIHGRAGRPTIWLKTPIGLAEWLVEHPGVLEWLRFRRVCTTEHFRNIGEIVHGAGLLLGAYVFTPSLAPLVGQSYVDLGEFVDVFAPMIYRNYPNRPGEACLNWELTIVPEELDVIGTPAEGQAMELVLSWTGLADLVRTRSVEEVRRELPPDAVGRETAAARRLLGPDTELVPIIHIEDTEMVRTVDLVRGNGADGVNFLSFADNWADLVGSVVAPSAPGAP